MPVLRHAEALDLWQAAAEIQRLSDTAREGKATREELTGSTITIAKDVKIQVEFNPAQVGASFLAQREEIELLTTNSGTIVQFWISRKPFDM